MAKGRTKKKGDYAQEAIHQFLSSRYFSKLIANTRKTRGAEFATAFDKILHDYYMLEANEWNITETSPDAEIVRVSKLKSKFADKWEGFRTEHSIEEKEPNEVAIKYGKASVFVWFDNMGLPYIKALTADAVGQDFDDHRAIMTLYKNKFIGEAPDRAGRPPKTEEYKKWRAEFKTRRKKGEKADDIIWDIAKREGVDFHHVRKIVRSRKYD